MSAVFPCSRECTQQIWNTIFNVLAILGICIMIEKLSVEKRRMYIYTPGWRTFYFITFMSITDTRWNRWSSRRLCCQFWWTYAGSLAHLVCLHILCCAILEWKTAVCRIFINYCQASFYCGLHLFMRRKHNSSLLLFLYFGARFLNFLLRFPHCGAWKPSFVHLGHMQCEAHVGQFQLYPTPLPCNSCRHVENL